MLWLCGEKWKIQKKVVDLKEQMLEEAQHKVKVRTIKVMHTDWKLIFSVLVDAKFNEALENKLESVGAVALIER